MLKLAARWLKNDHPHELEFEGFSEGALYTRTGAVSEPGTPKRFHSPKDLVALGIAGCTGVDVISILKKMRQPLEDLIIETELTQTSEHPRVFASCRLIYRYSGTGLEVDRVVRATALSYGKYCGVSAMIKRSGCHFVPQVYVNEDDVTEQFKTVLEEIESSERPSIGESSQAALLITGNEILFGKTQETNGRFLARNLTDLGFLITETRIVGDAREKLVETLQSLLHSNDVVFMTGGLGPTKDDLTSEVVSRVVSVPLTYSQEAWEICVDAFKKMGRTEIPESNKKQAMLPEGARPLKNSLGTAAGFIVSKLIDGRPKTVVALPGVPWECETMFEEQVRSLLPDAKSALREWGPWHIWGVGESAIQSLISDIERDIEKKIPQVDFSFQAHAGFVSYLIRAQFNQSADENIDIKSELDDLEQRLAGRILYKGRQTLLGRLLDLGKQLNLTISLAESCTGGRIAAEMTSLPGSSEIFKGGVVAYSNDLKDRLLGVRSSTLSDCGAVSRETAAEMAAGAASQLNSEVALAVTGIAGPSGGSEAKPVGTVCFALALGPVSKLGLFDRMKLEQSMGCLSAQGWTICEADPEILVVEKRFGKHLPRELIQKRASIFGLCSIVAVLESLRGARKG